MHNKTNQQLPFNKKFGAFFTIVCAVTSAFFYNAKNINLTYVFVAKAAIFLLITLIKGEILFPLNKLWMHFGLLLGMIVCPILLGIIFFGLFTQIAMLMRLGGLNELKLKFTQNESYWRSRPRPNQT